MQAQFHRTPRSKGKHLPLVVLLAGVVAAHATEFHVALNGKDSNRGTRSAPFASLERARAAVHSLKQSGGLSTEGVTVWIQSGEYVMASTFELGPDDGGEPKPTGCLSGG
jgi:hypothetical protein